MATFVSCKLICLFALLASSTTLILLYAFPADGFVQVARSSTECKPNVVPPEEPKIVLDWSHSFDGMIRECFDQSERPRSFGCTFTRDRSLVARADAIVFDSIINWNDVPPARHARQRYVFFSLEPPTHALETLSLRNAKSRNFFNWTMTYRSDSDFCAPYGTFERDIGAPLGLTLLETQLRGKSRTAAWFVSKCTPEDSRRETLVRQLAENGLEIDIFTKAERCRGLFSGTKNINFRTCGPTTRTTIRDLECLAILNGRYHFYLAFENIVCDEYVTEKLFDRVQFANVVPVVLSRAAAAVAIGKLPRKAVIAADDFGSASEMAGFLNRLRSNAAEYRSYLEWRKEFRLSIGDFMTGFRRAVGELCTALHDEGWTLSSTKVADIDDWWCTRSKCKRYFAEAVLFANTTG